jgi:hypothetical protein
MANAIFWTGLFLTFAFLIGIVLRGLYIKITTGFVWYEQRWYVIASIIAGIIVAYLLAWVGLKGWIGFVIMIAAGFGCYYWLGMIGKKKGA